MKILIYGAESFLGIQAIYRLYKDGHRVCGIYRTETPQFAADARHSKYVLKDSHRISEIIDSEKPSVIIYADNAPVKNRLESEKKLAEVRNLADSSAQYKIRKFVYLSSTAVYSDEKTAETDRINPSTLDGCTNALCEQAVLCFRTAPEFQNVMLRLGDVYGRFHPADDALFDMIRDACIRKRVKGDEKKVYQLIYAGDATDAIVRSLGDDVEGIYNITPSACVSERDIAKLICQRLDLDDAALLSEEFVSREPVTPPPNKKAATDMGFFTIADANRIIDECVDWYFEFSKAKRTEKRKKRMGLPPFMQTIETIVLFFAIVGLAQTVGFSNVSLISDVLMLYIIAITSLFGINLGIVSAVLVSIFDVYMMTTQGYSLVAALYNANVLVGIVQNLLIAVSIGYVIERKNFVIADQESVIEQQQTDNEYIRGMNADLTKIKDEHEQRLIKYEYGFGSIYAAINKLNSLQPREVLFKSLIVIRDMIEEQDISLYMIPIGSGYARRLAYIGNAPTKFPKTFKLSDFEAISDIVYGSKFYSNSYLDEKMPSVILPISANNAVIALVMIEHMSFEKMSLYYMNILLITGRLLNDLYSNARIYETLLDQSAYEDGGDVLKQEEFVKVVENARHASEESSFVYTVLETDAGEIEGGAATVVSSMRESDDVGRLANGKIGVLLYSTANAECETVIARLSGRGITARIYGI